MIQGVLLSVPEAIEDLLAMKRLWVHEILRTYNDRLVDEEDRNWLVSLLHEVLRDEFDVDMDKVFDRLLEPGEVYVN